MRPLTALSALVAALRLIGGIYAWADPPGEPRAPAFETGVASWYGYPFHGRVAADGEIYRMEALTAAHRTLPFNTWVRVVNLVNDKAVDVRITDRGPFIDGRIIDLSHAAARALEMLLPGTAPVRLEVLRSHPPAPGLFGVQLGAFRDRRNAERLRRALASRFASARLVLRDGDPRLWRVVIGAEADETAARALSTRLRQETSESLAFVVRIDP